MKHLGSILLVILLHSDLSSAQTMENIFKLIPEYYSHNLNQKEKDSLLKRKEYYPPGDSIESVKYNLDIDERNQYLRCEFGFTTGQNGFSILEARKFHKNDGTQILLVSKYSGVLRSYYQQDLQFFVIKNNHLYPFKNKLLPSIVPTKEFLKKNTPDSIVSKASSFLSNNYDLLPDTKNAVEFTIFSETVSDQYEQYFIGYTMRFFWTGSSFKKVLIKKE